MATLGVTWTAPTTNSDGSALTDLSHYLVQYRPALRAPLWAGSVITADTSVDLVNLPVDLDYDVRVAAVDTSGNTSAWSPVASGHTSPDAVAPPAPADPAVGNYLGQLRIEYLGTDNLGDPMPADTNRVDVHVSAVSGFTHDSTTRVASLDPFARGVAYADTPYGATRYVKLVAVDHTGNASAASGQVSGATSKVVSDDLLAGAVDAAAIADGAVENAKLGLGAVTGVKLADFAVDAPKIADGAVGTAKLANLAVGSAQIADLAVSTAKIASLAVGTAQIADLAVSGAKIDNLAVGSAKIADAAISTAKIADAAIVTAKIADLAVNNAKIADLSVGKLTAGTIDVEVLVGDRFTTASTGARVQLSSTGLQMFDASEALLVNIDGSQALLTGTYMTALSGRRIEIGSGGSVGDVDFYAPDGTHAQIRAWTESLGVEAIQLGVPMAGTGTLWNRINYNTDEWANYRARHHEFHYVDDLAVWRRPDPTGADTLRVVVDSSTFRVFGATSGDVRFRVMETETGIYTGDPGGGERLRVQVKGDETVAGGANVNIYTPPGGHHFAVWRADDVTPGVVHSRFRVTDTDVWFQWPGRGSRMLVRRAEETSTGLYDNVSAGIQLANHHNYGAVIRYLSTSTGTSQRLECNGVTGEGTWVPVWAQSFDVQSARASKTDVADLEGSALDRLRQARPRTYRRKPVGPVAVDGTVGPAPVPPMEVGFVAEEVPAEARVVLDDGAAGPGYSLSALLALTVAAVKELDARLDRIENTTRT